MYGGSVAIYRIIMKKFLFLCCIWISLPAGAALVSYEFTTVIDISRLGGDKEAPLRVVFSFDDKSDGFGSSNENSRSFGPASMVVTIGTESIFVTGAEIYLWNNTAISTVGFPEFSDGFSVNGVGGTTAGQILGKEVSGFVFSILDTDQIMFGGRPELPANADFSLQGDYQQTALYADRGSSVTPPRAPYILAVIPEPASTSLTAVTCGWALWRRRRPHQYGRWGQRHTHKSC